jgi:hypothetical protein
MIRHVLFWSLFVPVGARFSLDGWSALRKAHRLTSESSSFALSAATFCLLFQTCLVYWFTVILKSGKEWHLEGTALYYALSLDLYSASLGQWVLHNIPWVLKPLTWLTLIIEFAGVTLCFCPVYTNIIRRFVPFAMMGFHLLGIGLWMDVGPISYASCSLWFAFIPTDVWDFALSLWKRGKETRLKPILLFFEQQREWVIRTRNQHWVETKTTVIPRLALHPFWQVVCPLIMCYMLLWNMRGAHVPFVEKIFPSSVNRLAYYTRIDQGWGMFAPYPMRDDGWFVFPGLHHDKTEGDAFWQQSVVWEKSQQRGRRFRNEIWRKYVMNLNLGTNADYRTYFMQYLCSRHNESLLVGAEKKWDRVSFYYVLEMTPPPGKPYLRVENLLVATEVCTPY